MKEKIVRLVAVLLAVSSFSYVVFVPQRAKAASYSVDFYTPSADTTLAAFLVNSAATVGINLVSEGMDNAELISNIFLFGDDYAQENGYADFRAWWAANRPGVGESALIDRLAWDAGSMVVGSIGARTMRQIGSYIKNRVFGENADSDGGTVAQPVTALIQNFGGVNVGIGSYPVWGYCSTYGASFVQISNLKYVNFKNFYRVGDVYDVLLADDVTSGSKVLLREYQLKNGNSVSLYFLVSSVSSAGYVGSFFFSIFIASSGNYYDTYYFNSGGIQRYASNVSVTLSNNRNDDLIMPAVVNCTINSTAGVTTYDYLGVISYTDSTGAYGAFLQVRQVDSSPNYFRWSYLGGVVAPGDFFVAKIQAQNTNVNFTPPSDDEMGVVFSTNSQYEISEILATMGNIALQVDNTAITLQSVVDQVSQQAITVNQTAVSVGELIEEIGKVKTSPGNFGTLGEALGETDIDLMDLIGIVGTIAQILELLQGETVVIQDENSETHTVGLPDVIGEVLGVPVPDDSQAEMVLKQILEALEGGQTNSPGTTITAAEMSTPTPTPTASQIVTVTPVPTITLPPPDDDYPTNDQLQRLGEALTTRFPFCIPWDLYRGVNALNSQSAQAPQIQIDFMNQIKSYAVSLGVDADSVPDLTFTIDFTIFDPLAKLIRWTELIGYGFFLMAVTRKIIWH